MSLLKTLGEIDMSEEANKLRDNLIEAADEVTNTKDKALIYALEEIVGQLDRMNDKLDEANNRLEMVETAIVVR